MEKKKRHKWGNNNKRSFKTCEVCGCERTQWSFAVSYKTRSGEVTAKSPDCILDDIWVNFIKKQKEK